MSEEEGFSIRDDDSPLIWFLYGDVGPSHSISIVLAAVAPIDLNAEDSA